MSAAPGQAGGCSGNRDGEDTWDEAADGGDGAECDAEFEALLSEMHEEVVAETGVVPVEDGPREPEVLCLEDAPVREPVVPVRRVSTKRPAESVAQRQRSVSPRVAGAGSGMGEGSSQGGVSTPGRRESAGATPLERQDDDGEEAVRGDLLVVPVARVHRGGDADGPLGGDGQDG
ncbi:MAG: hypothetical protein GY772_28995, partial [bacterium]|nr:hypothetical protein [bacterium]